MQEATVRRAAAAAAAEQHRQQDLARRRERLKAGFAEVRTLSLAPSAVVLSSFCAVSRLDLLTCSHCYALHETTALLFRATCICLHNAVSSV